MSNVLPHLKEGLLIHQDKYDFVDLRRISYFYIVFEAYHLRYENVIIRLGGNNNST